MLYQAFTQTAYKIEFTRNDFGERVYHSQTEFKCMIKEITSYDRQNRMEFTDCDTMMWSGPGHDLNEGNIIKIDDVIYIISKLVLAKRLGSNIVEFVKCGLKRQAESIS